MSKFLAFVLIVLVIGCSDFQPKNDDEQVVLVSSPGDSTPRATASPMVTATPSGSRLAAVIEGLRSGLLRIVPEASSEVQSFLQPGALRQTDVELLVKAAQDNDEHVALFGCYGLMKLEAELKTQETGFARLLGSENGKIVSNSLRGLHYLQDRQGSIGQQTRDSLAKPLQKYADDPKVVYLVAEIYLMGDGGSATCSAALLDNFSDYLKSIENDNGTNGSLSKHSIPNITHILADAPEQRLDEALKALDSLQAVDLGNYHSEQIEFIRLHLLRRRDGVSGLP